MAYLYIKALHVFFVISWLAGLFYLPRIFVNLAQASNDVEYLRLLKMAHKLSRFMLPLAFFSILTGGYLWLGYGIHGAWLHAKLFLVFLLVIYQIYCFVCYKKFATLANKKSHIWFRVYNEIPAIILLLILLLVIVKPF